MGANKKITWDTVRQVAEFYNLGPEQVVKLIDRSKRNKRSWAEYLLAGMIKQNMDFVKDKGQVTRFGKVYKRRDNEEDLHFAIRLEIKRFINSYNRFAKSPLKPGETQRAFRNIKEFFQRIYKDDKANVNKYSKEISFNVIARNKKDFYIY